MVKVVSANQGVLLVLRQLQSTLGEAEKGEGKIVSLLQQKNQDSSGAKDVFQKAAQPVQDINTLLGEAGLALSGVTPFVTCDPQTGTPDCKADGKELVTQPLDQAFSQAQDLNRSVSEAEGTFGSSADRMESIPDDAAVASDQIKQSIYLIEQAKGMLSPGDPDLGKLNETEQLLQGAGSAQGNALGSLKPFLQGYENAQTFVNGASGSAGDSEQAISAAQSKANAIDCQGDCGGPDPVSGTYDPNGTGTITGRDDANQAIYAAESAVDNLPPSFQQASQAIDGFLAQLSPVLKLFTDAQNSIQAAKKNIDSLLQA